MCEPDEERARDLMGDQFDKYRRHLFDNFVYRVRYADGRRAPGWANDEHITCAVVMPKSVSEKWHVVINDPELIAEARYYIRSANLQSECVCEDDPSAVLVLCPIQ